MNKQRQQQGSSHSSIRNRKYEQKLKLINFNNESTLQQNNLFAASDRQSSKSFTNNINFNNKPQ